MDPLKKYYTQRIWERYPEQELPPYTVLSDKQKKQLRNSLGFASYQFHEAVKDFRSKMMKLIRV